MIVKLISAALILFTTFMGIKHGWQGLNAKPGDTGPAAELFSKINLSPMALKLISLLTLISAVMIVVNGAFLQRW